EGIEPVRAIQRHGGDVAAALVRDRRIPHALDPRLRCGLSALVMRRFVTPGGAVGPPTPPAAYSASMPLAPEPTSARTSRVWWPMTGDARSRRSGRSPRCQ